MIVTALINNKKAVINLTSQTKELPEELLPLVEYLGEGEIYSYGDIVATTIVYKHFWKWLN